MSIYKEINPYLQILSKNGTGEKKVNEWWNCNKILRRISYKRFFMGIEHGGGLKKRVCYPIYKYLIILEYA